jgi:hypothetical protein
MDADAQRGERPLGHRLSRDQDRFLQGKHLLGFLAHRCWQVRKALA